MHDRERLLVTFTVLSKLNLLQKMHLDQKIQ